MHFFSFNILIGCYSTNIWMKRIIPGSVAHIAAWKPSSFLHVPGSACSPRLLKSTKTQLKSWQQCEDIYRWRAPCFRAEAALDLSYSGAVWTVGPHSAAAFSLGFSTTTRLWRPLILQHAWNSLGIYYWILNSVQKMRKGLHGTLLL